MISLADSSPALRQYVLVTAIYWAFTLTDGALRMLVVLHFHTLGYSPLQIALLFVFYELFGVITNLFGGWLGARLGLNKTMSLGVLLQVIALSLLLVPEAMLTVAWVMAAQALSGIAKDLNKMSAKSAVKLLVPEQEKEQGHSTLYRWVALLTGSKNTLKGLGFFLGAGLLALFEFRGAVAIMAAALALVWLLCLFGLQQGFGRAKSKPKFSDIFSKSRAINYLSAARLFLFAARDVWFVVALPVYLATTLQWSHWQVGGFLALWVMAYGVAQAMAPRMTGGQADGRDAVRWALLLSLLPAAMAVLLWLGVKASAVLIVGLFVFGLVFAVNSSLHSYLIVRFSRADAVSLDVGFYYMANAMGRLVGTLLSGILFQWAGLGLCLWVSAVFVLLAGLLAWGIPVLENPRAEQLR
jgi:predicted MFS family arabinose efflux permease